MGEPTKGEAGGRGVWEITKGLNPKGGLKPAANVFRRYPLHSLLFLNLPPTMSSSAIYAVCPSLLISLSLLSYTFLPI